MSQLSSSFYSGLGLKSYTVFVLFLNINVGVALFLSSPACLSCCCEETCL